VERATFLSFSEPWSWSQCRPEAVKHKGTVDVGMGSPETNNRLQRTTANPPKQKTSKNGLLSWQFGIGAIWPFRVACPTGATPAKRA